MQLSDHSFLKRFPQELSLELSQAAEVLRFAPSEPVIAGSPEQEAICLVLEGAVELADSAEPVSVIEAGGCFGDVGLLARVPRGGRVLASYSKGAVVAWIPKSKVISVIQRTPVGCVIDLLGRISGASFDREDRSVREVLRKERMSVIGEMANKVIHDFKGPFTAISMGVEMVERHHGDEKTRRYCDMMHRNLNLMHQMMQELLDFISGSPHLHRRTESLRGILSDLAEDNHLWLNDQKIHLAVAGEDCPVDVDAGRIRRALQNLVLNSVEAFERGSGGRIQIRISRAAGHAELVFEDDGPGLPAKLGASVFDPFVTDGKKGGTGLGLAIARGIVEAHGGSLSIGQSSLGSGACFVMQLPVPVGSAR